MYDAVFVLVEAFNKILRKKPDQFRNNIRRSQTVMTAASTSANASGPSNAGGLMAGSQNGGGGGGMGGGGGGSNSASRPLDCNTGKGWVTPWEHGDKISRYLRKVSKPK